LKSRAFPALFLRWPIPPPEEHLEILLAEIDDNSPTAVEDHATGLNIYFSSADDRDSARSRVAMFDSSVTLESIAVDDEAWAERSQASVGAIDVGRITVAPPWVQEVVDPARVRIVIEPSMGFGTGHHPSTRLCLALLQSTSLDKASVLDVGTGSGVLAIAAWRLGAERVVAMDYDADALTSARENVERNDATASVTLARLDLTDEPGRPAGEFDVVVANLTGAMLARYAPVLVAFARAGGGVIASGFQVDEEAAVMSAFAALGLVPVDRAEESEWVAATFRGTLEQAADT
jgi:ribosomal protein L11 methyltransferase